MFCLTFSSIFTEFESFKCSIKVEEMAKNIFDATSPLSFMAKFCGYSMFTINQSDFTIASKRNDVIAQIWIIIMNVFFCAYLWDVGQNFNLHKSDILSKSLPIILSGSYGFYIFTIIASIALRRKQSTLMRLFYEIDEMVSANQIKSNFNLIIFLLIVGRIWH